MSNAANFPEDEVLSLTEGGRVWLVKLANKAVDEGLSDEETYEFLMLSIFIQRAGIEKLKDYIRGRSPAHELLGKLDDLQLAKATLDAEKN